MLLEPLILSFVNDTGNISLLLKMVGLLEKNFEPVDIAQHSDHRALNEPLVQEASQLTEDNGNGVLKAKMKSVTTHAREIILNVATKTSDAVTHSGHILIPDYLFTRLHGRPRRTAARQHTNSGVLSAQGSVSSRQRITE